MIKGKLVGLRAIEREDLILLRDWRNNPDLRKNYREVRELNLANQEVWYNMKDINEIVRRFVPWKRNQKLKELLQYLKKLEAF